METAAKIEAVPEGGVCELSPRSFARLAQFVTSELGIKMPDSKLSMVNSRLLRRVRDLGLNSVEEYAKYFFDPSHGHEREQFINAITTNKTEFFREPAHFDYLTGVALPELARNAAAGFAWRVKVWSAGCSSGEEPYTLAMVLAEYAAGRPGFDFAILGTDVSTRVLYHARAGIYQEAQIAPIPAGLLRKYVWQSRKRGEALVRIAPDLRRKITFERLNFMDEDYGFRDLFHVVFFRNVMIYFDRPTQEAVVNKICRNLAPGGYLFVGHSESLAGLDIPVKLVKTSIFRKPIE